MTPFHMPSVITYCCSLLAMDPSVVVFDVWFRKYCDLEICQGSLKVIKTGTIQQIGYGFLLVFYRNFVHKTHLFLRYSSSKNTVTLKLELGSLKVTENDTIWYTTYDFLWLYVMPYLRYSMLKNIATLKSQSFKSQSRPLKMLLFDGFGMVSY